MRTYAVILLLVHLTESMPTNSTSDEFNREYTGVVFTPYIKRWNQDGTIPNWKNYTFEDVKYFLRVVSTKFGHMTTHSMGAGRANESWNTGDVQGLTAVAAAQINAEANQPLITLAEGFWHSSTSNLFQKEAENGLDAARIANEIYPNTVWGLVLTSLSWMDYYRSWKDAATFLFEFRPTVHAQGLKIGIRLDICEQITQKKVPAVGIENLSPSINKDAETQGEIVSDIQRIAENSDFLICVLMPPANAVGNGVEATVTALGTLMLEQEAAFKRVNPSIEVTWETGWPSAGVSRFGSNNTVRNLQKFWRQMNIWTSKTKRRVYMRGAFDEPWRTNPNSTKDLTDPEGPNGGESHFGWWYLENNDNIESIKEKIPEPEVSEGLSIVAFAGIILTVLVVIIGVLLWKLKLAKKQIDRLSEKEIREFFDGVNKTGGGNSDDTVQNALDLPYDQSFELPSDSIQIDELELLGEGAFGAVYKGKIKGMDEPIAFKRPNSNATAKQLKNLLAEIKIMIYIGRHENVLRLVGASTQGLRDGHLYIASECCGMGSLETHLRGIPRTFVVVDTSGNETNVENEELSDRYVNHVWKSIDYANAPGRKPPTASLLRWAYEIANGMNYLGTKKIVHADLAARNVLLTSEGVAKISDFGLSRRLYEYTQYVKSSQEPLPWRWMAIESLKNMTFSTYSDVWAYGVLLWEIFTLGDMPFPGLSWNVDFVTDLENGLRMSKPKFATDEIYAQMVQCWYPAPKSRPAFSTLHDYFKSAYENLEIELL